MYKLVAIDLDGTLLTSNGTVSEKTREAIKYAVEKRCLYCFGISAEYQIQFGI